VIAWTLSRLVCAVPANSTARPPGGAIACRESSWRSERSENSGATLSTVSRVVPDWVPVAADGGPTSAPLT